MCAGWSITMAQTCWWAAASPGHPCPAVVCAVPAAQSPLWPQAPRLSHWLLLREALAAACSLSFSICRTKPGRPNSNHKWKHFEGATDNCQMSWEMTKQPREGETLRGPEGCRDWVPRTVCETPTRHSSSNNLPARLSQSAF